MTLAHTAAHIEEIARLAESGGGRADADTVLSERSNDVARLATGAVCDAVDQVMQGEHSTAFCLLRPPGHHALADRVMGFGLFNHVAVAARYAQQAFQLERVLIADFDVHHGNGTQAIFWEDPSVTFLSMHRAPFYPFTGAADETGAGRGLGTTLNLPVAFGTAAAEQVQLFADRLERFANRFEPDLVLISAGFDSHRLDPIGNLQLDAEDFAALTEAIVQVARQHTGGRLVSVLEGGYNPHALAECVQRHLQVLSKPVAS
ncbi:histone deacetylase family protein [Roseimaritima sediminicola]|uniref:histone deacetylase family protein n=1 Tax=Roseimaritima sediminicola TaxID=2662066 RepID=UPI001F37D50B|nr:histone deacetylase [Roseimaritima sediminicola]